MKDMFTNNPMDIPAMLEQYMSFPTQNQNEDLSLPEEFLQMLSVGDEESTQKAAMALHELLNIRENSILKKTIHITSAVIKEVNANGSCTIIPSSAVNQNPLEGKTFNNGVWSNVNNISIFQNLEPGDEVLVLSYGNKNKTNSFIIGVHQQKTKQKFKDITQTLRELKEFYDLFQKREKEFLEYKEKTDNTIKKLETKIEQLESNISALSSSILSI